MISKETVRSVLENPNAEHFSVFSWFFLATALVSVAVTVVHVLLFPGWNETVFHTISLVTVGIFTIEFILRLWCAEKKYAYLFSYFGFVDIVSIVPTYLGLGDFAFLKTLRIPRSLRLLRVLEVSKVARFVPKQHTKE